MKAIAADRYGAPVEVLRLVEVDTPEPKEDEVLIEVKAAGVNAYDWHLVRADPWVVRLMGGGFSKPKYPIQGADVSGVVRKTGSKVTSLREGDEVFGDLSSAGNAAFAEYTTAKEQSIAKKLESLSFEEAAALPMASLTALQGLRDHGRLKAGQRVLIHGASGGVGHFAVQIAKALGAQVDGVCSTKHVELVKELGAERVFDYTKEDCTKSGVRYDLILAVNGNRLPGEFKQIMTEEGICAMAGGTNRQIFGSLLLGPISGLGSKRKFTDVLCRPTTKDLLEINELIADGKLRVLVDKVFPLEAAAEAIQYMEESHPSGKIVIRIRD